MLSHRVLEAIAPVIDVQIVGQYFLLKIRLNRRLREVGHKEIAFTDAKNLSDVQPRW